MSHLLIDSRGRVKNKKWLCFLALLATIPFFLPLATTKAQDNSLYAVDVVESTGMIESDRVVIIGQVENTLSIPITDVVITIILYENLGTETITVGVDSIPANTTEDFTATKEFISPPSHFVAYIASYKLVTSDINLLLDYFLYSGNDIALRNAVSWEISSTPQENLYDVIERFEMKPEVVDDSANSALNDLVEDLLLMPILASSNNTDAAMALLSRFPIYSTEEYQEAYRILRVYEANSTTSIPLLSTAAQNNKPLLGLLHDSLLLLGDMAVPALLIGSQAEDINAASFSAGLLQEFGRDTVTSQLRIEDMNIRLIIIDMIRDANNPEYVLPLLETAANSDDEYQVVRSILLGWGPTIAPELIDGLNLPNPFSRRLAEDVLILYGERVFVSLDTRLLQLGINSPTVINSGEAIERLAQYYQQRRSELISEITSDAIALLDSGKCAEAVEVLNQVSNIDLQIPSNSLNTMIEGYYCIGDYNEALELFQWQALNGDSNLDELLLIQTIERIINPVAIDQEPEVCENLLLDVLNWYHSPALYNLIGNFYYERGIVLEADGRQDDAIASFSQALLYSQNHVGAKIERGKIIVLHGWSASMILILGFIIFCWVLQRLYEEIASERS